MTEKEKLERKQEGDWFWIGIGVGFVLSLCFHFFITDQPFAEQASAHIVLLTVLALVIRTYHAIETEVFSRKQYKEALAKLRRSAIPEPE